MNACRVSIAVLLLGIACGCDKKDPNAPDTTNASRIFVSPGSFSFTSLGQTGSIRASFIGSSTPPPDSFWHFSSSNPGVASVSNNSSASQTVTAVANGTATIHITLDTVTDSADVPVTVNAPLPVFSSYNGTWKGEAKQVPVPFAPSHPGASCPGSTQSYAETATINVSASGAGTFTLTDTPGFDRPYQVTIPASLTFSGTGTFSFLGQPIPGQLSVTINDSTHLTFQETTTYGSCSNTYGGQLVKQ